MNRFLLYFVLAMCACYSAAQQNSSTTIQLKMNSVNGVFFPDYMHEEEALVLANQFKKDVGDSIHYRLGAINKFNCVSLDGVTCDTLRLYVFKLVPFTDPNKHMTSLASNVWKIEQTLEFYRISDGSFFLKDSSEYADSYFGLVYAEQ